MNVAYQRNFAAGLLYVVFGVAVAIAASRYRMGSLARMGPGYFPFAAGVALGIVGVWLMGQAARRGAPISTMGVWSGPNLIAVLSSILLFGLLVDSTGLLIAVTVLVGLSSRAHPKFSWRVLAISLSVLLLVTWTVFVLLLGLPFSMLPRS
jgi:hypothetical protein